MFVLQIIIQWNWRVSHLDFNLNSHSPLIPILKILSIYAIFGLFFWHFLATINRFLLFSTTQFFQNSKVSFRIAAADFACIKDCNSFGYSPSKFRSFMSSLTLQAPDLWKSVHLLFFLIFLHCSFALTWYKKHKTGRTDKSKSLYEKVLKTLVIRSSTIIKI